MGLTDEHSSGVYYRPVYRVRRQDLRSVSCSRNSSRYDSGFE